MDIHTTTTPVRTNGHGEGGVTLTAGQSLKIEYTGGELLDIAVPEGKVWAIRITVGVEQTDA